MIFREASATEGLDVSFPCFGPLPNRSGRKIAEESKCLKPTLNSNTYCRREHGNVYRWRYITVFYAKAGAQCSQKDDIYYRRAVEIVGSDSRNMPKKPALPELFTGHSPTCGSGKEFLEVSWVSGGVRRFSHYHESAQATLTRPKLTRRVRSDLP